LANGSSSRTFLDPAVLARLSAVPLFSRRPMQGSVSGRHPSPHRGSSVEFAEYRRYVQGDDLRRVDWRAFGRTERYYVKEFEADTNLRCCVVLDTSGSMGFGSKEINKIEYAKRLAGTLAYLAVQQGDAVGLSCVAGKMVSNLPPRRNPAHLSAIFDVLEQATPEGETQLVPILHELAESISQRAMIVILSDFFLPTEELSDCFEHLRFRKHDISVFQLLDPAELAFEFQRPTRFLDMEGGAPIFADPAEITERYHQALATFLADFKKMMLRSAIDYHRVSIDESYEKVLMNLLAGRHQARRVR